MERDRWQCVECEEKNETLHVHHLFYGQEPWIVPDWALVTLCEGCHEFACHVATKGGEGLDQFFSSAIILMVTLREQGVSSGDALDFACAISKLSPTEFYQWARQLPSVSPVFPRTPQENDEKSGE